MTQTFTETVRLTDGRALRMTIAEPEHAVRGGLIVLHGDAAADIPATLACEGWLTVVPESGEGQIIEDFDAAGVWLSERDISSDRLGVLGFDLGGGYALEIAAKRSIGAAVSIAAPGILEPGSASLPALRDIAGELSCPWLGVYGDADGFATAEAIEVLKRAVAGSEVAHDVLTVPGEEHRFDRDQEVAAGVLHRVVNWFDAHLR
ncbi:dienelactone hydrolase family protein [Sciscionella marina]|uniref:dienelactone hydrolase family protein n=1 Tax=Sciscionella marina TaxID=508770 RepID=UPI0003740F7E|nr:dienelactone hydrolase family protein [Sciscionella marina]